MARLRSLQPSAEPARPPRSEVDCIYNVVTLPGGEKLLRLATLGSDERKSEPKPSQIIELDEYMARQLLKVMSNVFPALDATS
jgi:hypothetical protein